MTSHREWDAGEYHRVAAPQRGWAAAVIARADLRGDETVLDAGCGSGRVTGDLLARLPEGRVVAVDASRAMLDAAREHLASAGDRVEFVHADLTALPARGDVDVVFSNAVFHHVTDHAALFRSVLGVLRPGGRLVAQCGGHGNLDRVRAVVQRVAARDDRLVALRGYPGPWRFAAPGETVDLLRRTGFTDADAWLTEAPVPFADPEDLRRHLRAITLRSQLARVADTPGAADALLDGVVATLVAEGAPALDHVRLDITARRPAAS